jgi:WXG100 family type VII secretion target
MAQIRMTPSELRDGAQFLGQRLDAINQEVQQLDARVNQVAGNWEGQAQSAFLGSYQEMLPVLKQTLPQVIDAMMQKLNGAANAIEETDQQIAQAFSS